MDKQSWDDSVKSLVATPSVLDMMSTKLDWTQALGNAVLAQQPDVMDAVQRLRAKAEANNKLMSTPQQTVSTQQQDGQQAIVIAPTDPDTIYVPYYDPSVVYGTWPYPAYPPYYWPAPGYIAGGIIATGIAFGAGYALGRWVSGGYRWGGGLNWGNRNININRSVNINNINARNNNWTHNPVHRQGVRYTNANVAQKFGGNRNVGGGSKARMDFRGRSGQQSCNRAQAPAATGPTSAAAPEQSRARAISRREIWRAETIARQAEIGPPPGRGPRAMRLATPVPPTGRALIRIEADRTSPQPAVAIAAVVEEHAQAEAVDTLVPPRSAAAVAVAVAAIGAVEADEGPIFGSSTTSPCWANLTTASASIASPTTAAKSFMSA